MGLGIRNKGGGVGNRIGIRKMKVRVRDEGWD